ncbi:MAG: L,D-transpeptidase family protein [bacterium]|nr:L,D-transpeptidase family protein [bacterium]
MEEAKEANVRHAHTMRHVSLKHHLIVVSALLGILLVLLIVLAMMLLRVDPFNKMESIKPSSETYLHGQEGVVVKSKGGGGETIVLPIAKVLFEYIEVVDGCDIHFEGACLRMRSGPGEDYPIVMQLRNHIVLKVGGKVVRDGRTWYKVIFDEWLHFPERATGNFYVAAEYVHPLLDEGNRTLERGMIVSSTKRIIVERGTQTLYAYDGETIFMKTRISTGLDLTPTALGTYTIFKKMPSRYMQGGPAASSTPSVVSSTSDQYYDLPGVPWNLYFTSGGAVIHGAYWHNNFGQQSSHGCVNLPPQEARRLYQWAEVGTRVIVRD